MDKDNHKTDVKCVATSLESAGASVVSASSFDAKAIIFMGDNMCIKIEKARVCGDNIGGNKICFGREIKAKL